MCFLRVSSKRFMESNARRWDGMTIVAVDLPLAGPTTAGGNAYEPLRKICLAGRKALALARMDPSWTPLVLLCMQGN